MPRTIPRRLFLTSVLAATLLGAAGARADSTCQAHRIDEPYPRLTVDRILLDGSPGTYVKERQCFPEPVVIRVEPCDSDEFTWWCCKGDGATPVTFRNLGDTTNITWSISPSSADEGGFFVETHGAMVSKTGFGDGVIGNETVVYYPPWKLAPGESRSIKITITGDDGVTPPAAPGQDDPPISPTCPMPPPSPPPPDYNPSLTFLVEVARDAGDGTYKVGIVPPTTPTCDAIGAATVPPCPTGGTDCGCAGQLQLKKGSTLMAIPDGRAAPITMCQGMKRPMNVLFAHDSDIAKWTCNTGTACETTVNEVSFRDALNHKWSPSNSGLGTFEPARDGESPVYSARDTGSQTRRTLRVDYTGNDGQPAWCTNSSNITFFDDPEVRDEAKIFIHPELSLDIGPFGDSQDEACLPGAALCITSYQATELVLDWPSPPPGARVQFEIFPQNAVKLFLDPFDLATEIPVGVPVPVSVIPLPFTVYARGVESGPVMIQLLGTTVNGQETRLMSFDTVAATVAGADLLDCCGERIPEGTAPANNCDAKPYPPAASECCALEFIDDLDVVYSVPDLSGTQMKAFYVARDAMTGAVVFEQEIPPGENLVAKWHELKRSDGGFLNVGPAGRPYEVRIEVRDGGLTVCQSGDLPVFVDNCALRNLAIQNMRQTPPAFADPGFLIYLELLYDVSENKICKTIKEGLVDYSPSSFTDRCHVLCVNREFSNQFLALAPAAPGTPNNVVAEAHRKAQILRSLGNRNPLFPADTLVVQAYADAENILRGMAFVACGGKLNAADRQKAVQLVAQGVRDRSLLTFAGGSLRWLAALFTEAFVSEMIEVSEDYYDENH